MNTNEETVIEKQLLTQDEADVESHEKMTPNFFSKEEVDDLLLKNHASVISTEVDTSLSELNVPFVTTKQQKVTQEFALSRPITDADKTDVKIDLPTMQDEELYKFLMASPNIGILKSTVGATWFKVLEEARLYNTKMKAFTPTLENPNADFHQDISFNGKTLNDAVPKINISDNVLVGERAVMSMNSFLGRGTTYQKALWYSGFWITFKAPSESEYIELQRKLIADKVNFGRDSYGMVFSNTVVYCVDRLMDFALDHIYTTTLKLENNNIDYLKSLIDSRDIFPMLHGLLCTMFPRGFAFDRACVNDIENCNYITQEMLNITKMSFVDLASLTNAQRVHMSNRRPNSMDEASVKRYQSEMLQSQKRTISLPKINGNELKLTLKNTSVSEYVKSGYEWINNITNTAERAISDEVPINQREDFIIKTAQATAMRQYGHMVDSIEIVYGEDIDGASESKLIEDADSVNLCLDSLSGEDTIREKFFEEVTKYINDSTICVIGINSYECPSCGTTQEDPTKQYPRHTNVIPIDLIQLFFALLSLAINRLKMR